MLREYEWIGVDDDGAKLQGKIVANTQNEVRALLAKKHIFVLKIQKNYFAVFNQKMNQKSRLLFLEQLLVLLKSGVVLLEAISLMLSSSYHKKVICCLKKLHHDIEAGVSLSSALEKADMGFDLYFCKMIYAAEQSDQLIEMLTLLMAHQKKIVLMSTKVKKSLFYPLFILILSSLLSLGIVIFVVPQFVRIYESMGASLPFVTLMLVKISIFLHEPYAILSSVLFLSGLFFVRQLILRKIVIGLLKIPWCSDYYVTLLFFYWFQVISSSVSSYVPLVDAIYYANQTIRIAKIKEACELLRKNIIVGRSFHSELASMKLFAPEIVYLIRIGESADLLNPMLVKVVAYYEKKLEEWIAFLSMMVEPVMMVFIGFLISGMIVAIYLPVFRMGSIAPLA